MLRRHDHTHRARYNQQRNYYNYSKGTGHIALRERQRRDYTPNCAILVLKYYFAPFVSKRSTPPALAVG